MRPVGQSNAVALENLFERWVDKVAFGDDCWEWQGAATPLGYGRMKGSVTNLDKPNYAHRLAWELLVGPIPDGLTIDHLCRNPRCVRPAHLEPVTHKENLHRGNPRFKQEAAKTHCVRGHPLSGENLCPTGLTVGRRKCLTCREERYQQRRERYHADPEYREHWLRSSREARARKKVKR